MQNANRVAVIGAGPVGLAAAAHALERGLEPQVLEAGPAAGHAVRQWSHVRVFSPWRYNMDAASERLLRKTGWNSPDPDRYPNGAELLERYLEPLASRTALSKHIMTNARVTSIARAGFDKVKTSGRERAPFEIRYRNGRSDGVLHADAVIDASGTWFSPNPAGANGLEAIGEAEHRDRIAYGMPDVLGAGRDRYAGKAVAVLGAGHSAIGTIIDLKRLQASHARTRIIWILRGDDPEKSFGGGAKDQLAARGELGQAFADLVRAGGVRVEAAFRLTHISTTDDGRLRLGAGSTSSGRHVLADELIVATGFRPDLSFLREVRLALDPALECPPVLAPLIDPNLHSCGTVRPHGAQELAQPEPGFYFAGMKSYGRAPTFLLMTGYEQVRSIMAEIAGDHEAAERVELVLPETGVCNGPVDGSEGVGCCGGPPNADQSACCKADEAAKSAGRAGCGCS
jgi:NADPH-dependent 2,4-dienoyl-CoA reductase/sulfur reductase-like enzyme